jgi:hypothetical protein
MRSVEEILRAPADRDLWAEIDRLMLDEAVPLAAKQRLLAKLNEIMGEDDPCTAQDVDEYVRFLRTGDWTREE